MASPAGPEMSKPSASNTGNGDKLNMDTMNVNTPQVTGGFVLPGMKPDWRQRHHGARSITSMRMSFLNIFPPTIRGHFVATSGEFVGTFLFLFFAFAGTQVAQTTGSTVPGSGSDTSRLLYISLSFGFSLAVNAWVFFRISGGLFNPAVTFSMCLVGAVPWLRGALVIVTQIIGGIAAAGIVDLLFPGDILFRTELGGGTQPVQGLFIEMFLTAQLVFTIFMLAAEKHKGTFIAPVGIGLSLFIAELTGVYWTGGSVNPARSFGPCVISHKFDSYHWIYWIGPLLGGLLASGFYRFIKALEYETVNPDQDASENSEGGNNFNPEHDQSAPVVSFAPEEYVRQHTPTSSKDEKLTNGNGRFVNSTTPAALASGETEQSNAHEYSSQTNDAITPTRQHAPHQSAMKGGRQAMEPHRFEGVSIGSSDELNGGTKLSSYSPRGEGYS